MPTRRLGTTSGASSRCNEAERRAVEAQAVVRAGDRERLSEATRPGAEQPLVLESSAGAHRVQAVGRLERAQEQRGAGPSSSQTTFAHQWMP